MNNNNVNWRIKANYPSIKESSTDDRRVFKQDLPKLNIEDTDDK